MHFEKKTVWGLDDSTAYSSTAVSYARKMFMKLTTGEKGKFNVSLETHFFLIGSKSFLLL